MHVFISYQRSDVPTLAHRVYDAFCTWYTEDWDGVFLDVDSIPGGAEWENLLRSSLSSTDAILAVIGPQLFASEYVRKEISLALSLRIPVYVVLAPGVRFPSRAGLPRGTKRLLDRQVLRLLRGRSLADQLIPLWIQAEKDAYGFPSDETVWLRWLLSEQPRNGRLVSHVRRLVRNSRRYRALAKLSNGELEQLLDLLTEKKWLVCEYEDYDEGRFYYYRYDPYD